MKPKNIIIRCPNWIGDHVMATGFYRAIREAYPGARVTWLLRGNLVSLSFSGLADQKIPLPEDARKLGLGLWSFSKKIREFKFDLSISLPATLSSAALFCLAGIRERSGFSSDGNSLFYTSFLKWNGRSSKKHKAELYLELAEFLTGHPSDRVPAVEHLVPKEKKIVIAPGASILLREWPYFDSLLDELLKNYPEYSFVLVGTRESSKWHKILEGKNSNRIRDLIEKTSLDSLVEECKNASLVLANDSGVAHLAATMAGARTLVLFGPGDPLYIAPSGNVIPARASGLSCSPCEKPYCHSPYGYQACLKAIPALEVLKRVNQALH